MMIISRLTEEYGKDKSYTVNFSEWLTELRRVILEDTLKKIDER